MEKREDTSTQANYSYTLLRDQDAQSEPMLQPSAYMETNHYQQPISHQPSAQAGLRDYPQAPYPAPRVGLARPKQPTVVMQQVTRSADTSIRLPKYAFVTSVVVTVIFTALCWLPGFICLVPAVILSLVAITKKEGNRLKEAKVYSIISLTFILIFAVSYPLLVATLIVASVFGWTCNNPNYYTQSSIDGTYQKPYGCL